jgi:hypothetical protein
VEEERDSRGKEEEHSFKFLSTSIFTLAQLELVEGLTDLGRWRGIETPLGILTTQTARL